MNNIGKIVVSKEEGKVVGFVLDLVFEKFERVGFYVVEEESQEVMLLKNEHIINISKDFILIDNEKVLEFVLERNKSFIGKLIVDDRGFLFGRIRDLILEKNKCIKFVTDKCEILTKNIVLNGEDCVFVGRKTKRKKEIKKFQRMENEVKVQIMSSVPEKVVLSTNFYIGKVAKENVFGYNNEKIILKNELVNKAVVEKAKLHNKLNQLYFSIMK